MKTNQLKLLTVIIILGLNLLFNNCTNRQISNYDKAGKSETSKEQSSQIKELQKNNLTSQNQKVNSQKNIIVHFDQNKQYYRSIEFKNAIDLKKSSYDIIRNNPYNSLKYEVIGTDYEGNKLYKLKPEEIKMYYPDPQYTNGSMDDIQFEFGKAKSICYVYDESQLFTVVSYDFHVFEPNDVLIGVSSTFIVFSDKGEVVQKYENQKTNCFAPVVTNDGKYLCYSFGGNLDSNGKLINEGYKIIDLQINKTLTLNFIDESFFIQGKSIEHEMLFILLSGDEGKFQYISYNFLGKEIYYSRYYSGDDLSKFKKIQPDGFVFGINSNTDREEKIELFKKDFKVENI
jgi:hypothetical protein